MKNKIFLYLVVTFIVSGILDSCKKETAMPNAEIYRTIDKYTVTFDPHIANATSYLWNFGDGTGSSTEMKPVHTYESFGDYSVSLTVKGAGGEFTTTKIIQIEATSLKDLLTGGVQAVNGKTWIMSRKYNVGKDGAGPVMNEMPIVRPSIDNVLDMVGLGSEYDNEYTFYFDGTYKMNVKNGSALAGLIYGMATGTINGAYSEDVGLCQAAFEPAVSAWELHSDDLVVDAISDPNTTDAPPVHGNVTISGKNWVSVSSGAYFGILDFPSTAQFVIKEISSQKMNVALFLCAYPYDPNYVMLPTLLMHLTFEVKP